MSAKKRIIVNCAHGTKNLYDEVKDLFKRRYGLIFEHYQIFCLAASLGLQEKRFDCFTKTHSGGLLRTESLEKDTNAIRFIEAIAISHDKKLDVLSVDENRIYDIAECYANGGIKILYSMTCKNIQGTDFIKEIEKKLIEANKQNIK